VKSLSQKLELVGRDMVREKIRGALQPGNIQGLLETEVQLVLTEAINQMLSQEQADALGRGRYERLPGSAYRNGFKRVGIPGFFGRLWLRQPVLRRGGPGSSLLRALRQAGQATVGLLATRFWLRGASTRAVAQELNEAMGTKLHASTVSALTDQLLPTMEAWLHRPVPTGIQYLYLDALYLPVRRPGFTSKQALLVALGVDKAHHSHVLGFLLGDRESEDSWTAMVDELLARGLDRGDLRLVISDEHKAILAAVEKRLNIAHQVCVVHKLRNIRFRVAKRDRKDFLEAFKAIFWAESKAQGLQALGRFQGTWQKAYPKAVGIVVAGAEASMRFYDEPKALWVTLRSTNLIERFNKEIRRRFRPAGTMHSENAVLKLFWAVGTEQEKRWSRRRVRGGRTMDMQAASQAEASSAERLAA
jgi:putative transposase